MDFKGMEELQKKIKQSEDYKRSVINYVSEKEMGGKIDIVIQNIQEYLNQIALITRGYSWNVGYCGVLKSNNPAITNHEKLRIIFINGDVDLVEIKGGCEIRHYNFTKIGKKSFYEKDGKPSKEVINLINEWEHIKEFVDKKFEEQVEIISLNNHKIVDDFNKLVNTIDNIIAIK